MKIFGYIILVLGIIVAISDWGTFFPSWTGYATIAFLIGLIYLLHLSTKKPKDNGN